MVVQVDGAALPPRVRVPPDLEAAHHDPIGAPATAPRWSERTPFAEVLVSATALIQITIKLAHEFIAILVATLIYPLRRASA
jgi:hypothetical protein